MSDPATTKLNYLGALRLSSNEVGAAPTPSINQGATVEQPRQKQAEKKDSTRDLPNQQYQQAPPPPKITKAQQADERKSVMAEILAATVQSEIMDAVSKQAEELTKQYQQEKIVRKKERDAAHAERIKQLREEQAREKDILKKRDAEGKVIERPKKPKPPEPEKVVIPMVKKVMESNQDGFQTEVTEVIDPVSQRVIKKITKAADQKGNLTNVVTLFDEKGHKKQVVQQKAKPNINTPAKAKETPNQVSASLLAANPFSAVLRADSVESPEEIQAQKAAAVEKGQKAAAEKEKVRAAAAAQQADQQARQKAKEQKEAARRAQIEAAAAAKAAEEAKSKGPANQAKGPQAAQGAKKAEPAKPTQPAQSKQQPAKQPQQPAKQPAQPKQEPKKEPVKIEAPKNKPADPVKTEAPAPTQKKGQQPKQLKKTGPGPQVKKPVAFWEDETLQPVLLLIAFLVVAAGLGYTISL